MLENITYQVGILPGFSIDGKRVEGENGNKNYEENRDR